MRVLITGGSGDLGEILAYRLQKRGDVSLRFDIRAPSDSLGQFIEGSILDRKKLSEILMGVDCIVHIAAWHGYHEFTKQKNCYDFWDLNVTGTFNIFQAALEHNIKNIVFISSESVADSNGMYGWTKILGEQIAQRYFDNHHLNILTLRPRAFIPHWNKTVYPSFIAWAKWYWQGAVHISDMAQATLKSIDLLSQQTLDQHLILPVDGAYEYTTNDLLNFDKTGSGETFKRYYEKFYDQVINLGLDPTLKPTRQDISATKKWLGYAPQYSLMTLLKELAKYGENGPQKKLD